MLSYLIRRIVIGMITLLLITFVVYGLVRNMPGTPLTIASAESDPSKNISKEDLARLTKIYGLDKPWWQAYFVWIGNVARLDFGHSISRKQPVAILIRERMPATLMLSVTSVILTYLLSIPLGLRATVRSGTFEERSISMVLYMLYSLPAFVAALFLQILIAVKLGWLPLMGIVSDDYEGMSTLAKTWDICMHAFMPVLCFTYGGLAYDSRFIKANMEEVIRQDYIRTAKAKGVHPTNIVLRHAFRNTLIPLVTMLGLTLPGLLGGAILLEQIFQWPGMGRLFFESLSGRDYPTIMGLVLMFSVLTLLGQLLADVLYAFVDPRVSLS
ncbi:MAG: ABC transporter permease [Planctomycetota bacterium]